jgi:uncharacterized protein (UPF0262 family)
MSDGPGARLVDIRLDEASLAAATAEAEHERRVAIFDLLEDNRFTVDADEAGGPYALSLAVIDRRLVFDVTRAATKETVIKVMLSLTPLRPVIKDYFLICESYHQAIRSATPSQIEAIDMGRRGLHNQGSEILQERLAGKITLDLDTARRLFTLICALHVRG